MILLLPSHFRDSPRNRYPCNTALSTLIYNPMLSTFPYARHYIQLIVNDRTDSGTSMLSLFCRCAPFVPSVSTFVCPPPTSSALSISQCVVYPSKCPPHFGSHTDILPRVAGVYPRQVLRCGPATADVLPVLLSLG